MSALVPDAMSRQDPSDTIRIGPSSLTDSSRKARMSQVSGLLPGLVVAKGTHAGQVRQRNEDSFLALDASYFGNGGLVGLALFVVADGMGGHQDGDVASLLAARVAATHIAQDVFVPFLAGEAQSSQHRPLTETLTRSVQAANDAVCRKVPQAGTTLTLALVLGDSVHLAHVGDSRAYVLSDGRLQRITQDHSLAARLVQMGRAASASQETLATTPRNILYRAVGHTEAVEVDIHMHRFSHGDRLLLCTDGLWGKVTDVEICGILTQAPDVQTAVEQLLKMATERGGEDNMTALLVARNAP